MISSTPQMEKTGFSVYKIITNLDGFTAFIIYD